MKTGYRFENEDDKHLHTLEGQPLFGTSTVVGILNKPLTWWAAGMAVEKFGWKNPKKHSVQEVATHVREKRDAILAMDIVEYTALLKEAYYAHSVKMKDSAEAGTDMHAELEKYVKDCIATNEGKPKEYEKYDHKAVELFAKWSVAEVDTFIFSEGHCFSSKYWLGGISDVGAKMKSGKIAIIDFKSSESAYYSQFVQGGGYAVQVEENGILDAEGNQILPPFVTDLLIIVPFRDEKIKPRTEENVPAYKEAFLGALTNYQLNKSFDE